MMHPDTELRLVGETIGFGVFAKALIPKGTMVYISDPLEIVISKKRKLKQSPSIRKIIDKYSYIDHRGRYVLSWDHAKYVNHSCSPNTMSTGYGFEIALVDILPGEEITDEYGLLNLEEPMLCECGSVLCRGQVKRNDGFQYADLWDELVKSALRRFQHVGQPLASLYPRVIPKDLLYFFSNEEKYKSLRTILLPENEAAIKVVSVV